MRSTLLQSSAAYASYFCLTLLPAGVVGAESVYVSSWGFNQVTKIDGAGDTKAFSSPLLNGPTGIAFDGSGNLYVANQWGNTVVKFDANGHGSVYASLGLNQPTGIAFDSDGNLYVANAGNNLITKHTSGGAAVIFASAGISNPVGMTIDSNDNLYVANYFEGRIKKVTPAGQVSTFVDGVNEPFGLAYDAGSGHVYVGLAATDVILRYDLAGSGGTFASTGIDNPEGVAVDAAGFVYVANYYAASVTKFDLNGQPSVLAATGMNRPTFLTIGPDVAALPEPGQTIGFLLTVGAGLVIHWRFRPGGYPRSRA